MIESIPILCADNPMINFIIGGDGPMTIALEEMIERNRLQDRVQMLGPVKHSNVRNVLVQGDIFLNCSLTEAFCIAIVEAASCGLLVVSTNVGGVPEVLPNDILTLAEPSGEDIVQKIKETIPKIRCVDKMQQHERVKKMYSWFDVAERTDIVYDRLLDEDQVPLIDRLRRFYACGPWAGKIFCIVVAVGFWVWLFYEWLIPRENIEIAKDMGNLHQHINYANDTTFKDVIAYPKVKKKKD